MEQKKITALGDSLTRGVVLNDSNRYSILDNSFIDIIGDSLGLDIRNYGKFGCTIVIGQHLPRRHPGGQRGSLLHLQPVTGQMLGDEGQGMLHRGLPAVHGLTGQTIDEVEGNVFDFKTEGGILFKRVFKKVHIVRLLVNFCAVLEYYRIAF